MSIIRVAASSRTAAVAGANAGSYRDHGVVEIQAIGASAVNQAIKAIVIAKGYLAEEDKEILFVPSMVEVEIEGAVRTAVRLTVENKEGKLR